MSDEVAGRQALTAAETVILEMWRESAHRRAERRNYEWKVTLAFWAGLLLVANATIGTDGRFYVHSLGVRIGITAVFVLATVCAVVLHGRWLFGFINPAHRSDREHAIHYEAELSARLGIDPPLEKDKVGFTSRSSSFQIGVSVFLGFITSVSISSAIWVRPLITKGA